MILQKFSQLYQHVKGTDQKLFNTLDTISLNFDTISKSLSTTSTSAEITIYKPSVLTANATFNSSIANSSSILIIITRQDGTGGRTITWGNGFAYSQNVTLSGDLLANTQCVFIFVLDPQSGKYNMAAQPIIGMSV